MTWKKKLMMDYEQEQMIMKIYNHFWDKYEVDDKDCYNKFLTHYKCKKDTKFEIDKMNFLKKSSIDYNLFDEYMRRYESELFNELLFSIRTGKTNIIFNKEEEGEKK